MVVSILVCSIRRHVKRKKRISERTEENPVVRTSRASEGAGRVILRVTISIMAPILEEPRVGSGATASLPIGAAILVRLKDGAGVVASPLGP